MPASNCPSCSSQVDSIAKYCPHCGTLQQRPSPEPPPLPQDSSSTRRERRNAVLFNWVVAAFLGLFGVLGIATFVSERGASESAASDSPSTPQPQTAVESAPQDPQEMLASVEDLADAGPRYRDELEHARLVLREAANLERRFPDTPEAEEAARLVEEWRAEVMVLEEEARLGRLADKWEYQSTEDPMTGETTRGASIRSENTVHFDFPYQGEQHAHLFILYSPSAGVFARLQLDRGQFLCTPHSGCTVQVRFDERAPQRWQGVGPSDGSRTTVYLGDTDTFLRQLRESSKVLLQTEVYQEGAPIFEFHVEGFDYDQFPELQQRDRAIRAEQERARAEREEARRFIEEHPYVGNPETDTYLPTDEEQCRWWGYMRDTTQAEFFTSAEDAEAAGFRRSVHCR